MKLKFNPLPLGDGLNFFCYVLVSSEAPVVLHFCLFFFEDYGVIINKNNIIYQDNFGKYAEKIWRMMKQMCYSKIDFDM
ncbi:MAG TPA: hypothetical protein DCY19_01250 [Eubacterium sp.]|nr:hypothetical protein [Eubacterium sp.]